MTLAEFKAWFDGFTEEMDEAPTKKQWERIKKRVKEIDGSPVTERVFVDRYWAAQRHPHGWWELMNQYQSAMQNQPRPLRAEFSSTQALCSLGRAEYKSEAA
jgi:hypothetical protein